MTFKITAVLLWCSALFELLAVSTSVPVFGRILISPDVMLYHLLFIVLFITLGIGLWFGKSWGLHALLITCLIYAADKIQVAVYTQTLQEYLVAQLQANPQVFKLMNMDMQLLMETGVIEYTVFMIQVMSYTMAACWIGFAVYGMQRRAYFQTR